MAVTRLLVGLTVNVEGVLPLSVSRLPLAS
jgi:hypothetical protein